MEGLLVDVLAEGIARGELRDDLDPVLVADTLIGPLFYRRLMTPEPLPTERVEEIVSLVLG